MARPPKLDAAGRPRVSPWPYIITAFIFAVICFGGYGLIRLRDRLRVSAEACFKQPERVYDAITEKCEGIAISADGRRAVGWTRGVTLYPAPRAGGLPIQTTSFFLFDLGSGRELKTIALDIPDFRSDISRVLLAADGKRVLMEDRRSIYAGDLDGDQGFRRLASAAGGFQHVCAFAPDGRSALLGSDNGSSLSLWDLEQDRERQRLAGGTGDGEKAVDTAAFSPDGARAAAMNGDGKLRLWDLATGKELYAALVIPERDGLASPGIPVFTPDGKRIVVYDTYGIALCDAASGKVLHKFARPGKTTAIFFVRVSPDGRRLLGGGRTNDGQAAMWLWDIETGRLIRRFEFPDRDKTVGSIVEAVAFSPDGRWAFSAGLRDFQFMDDFSSYVPKAELMRWRLPDALGYRLLGTEKEETPAAAGKE